MTAAASAHARRAEARPAARPVPGRATGAPAAANPTWSRLALGAVPIQAKLRVGATDDPLEREADRVAEAVVSGSATPPTPVAVQRKCAGCAAEEETAVRRSPAALPVRDEEEKLQAKRPAPSSSAAPEVGSRTAARIGSLSGGGEPMSPAARRYFEPRLGRDLSAVRLHTGAEAAAAAREVGARAFTVGPDVAFGAGEYRPDSSEGRKLLAHELAHTVQQGAGANLRRAPVRPPEDDPIHQPILEQYRREEGLPLSGIDPDTGRPVGPSPAAIKYGPWPGDVSTPTTKPSLAAVPQALPVATCGKVVPGMDPAQAEPIRDCIVHARFVNLMNQSIANMAQVASPYAPGIASAYQAVLAEVVKAGLTSPPTATTPRTFAVKNLTVTASAGVTLSVARFELLLMRRLNGPNGVSTGSGIELNEESRAALFDDQADLERTMYHEGFHWLSGEVGAHNRTVKRSGTGSPIRPELDHSFVDGFESEFRAAGEPIWKDILATVPLQPGIASGLTPQKLSALHWLKVSNEILSRVEEAVYLELRQGRGFSRRFDLPALKQDWLRTSDYWDSGVIFVRFHLQKLLDQNRDRVERELLPVVQRIQREYLRRRPQA